MEFLNRFWSNVEIGSWTTQLVNSESRTSWAFEHREQGENAQFVQHKPKSSWFITIVCQSTYITPLRRSGLALLGGMHPICQKGAKNLFGIGYGLIHSVLETPKAPTHPHLWRRGVAGISTSKDKNHVTAPLVSKGDIVESFVLTWLILFQIHSITYLCYCYFYFFIIYFWVFSIQVVAWADRYLLRRPARHRWSPHSSWKKGRCEGLVWWGAGSWKSRPHQSF